MMSGAVYARTAWSLTASRWVLAVLATYCPSLIHALGLGARGGVDNIDRAGV
jgi:hypothetical protein